MRILALTTQYPTPYRPHSCAHNRQQIRALAERAELRVIAPVAWTQEWAAGREERRRSMPRNRWLWRDSIRINHPRFLYLPAMFRKGLGQWYRLSVRRVFDAVLRQFQPDVIYAPWAYPDGWTAVRLGHAADRPVVVKVMGSDVHTLAQYPGRRPGTIETLREADRIVAVSRQLADEVVELGADPERVHVVYNGVDQDLFCPGSRTQAQEQLGLEASVPRLLFVGNLVPVKQVPVLLDACAILRNRERNFHCHILGEGPLRKSLAAQIERLQLEEHITLEGVRPHAELADWFRAADVVILPSQSEGVPNVLLEAKACGVPFVASRVGGIPEIAGRADRLVPANDPPALANAIASLLSEVRPDVPEGKPHATWSESAEALLAVFHQVMPPRSRVVESNPETISARGVHQHSH